MRDVAFTLFVIAGLLLTLRAPFVGVLMWVWIAIMNPSQQTYGFGNAIEWNLIVAIVTISSWLCSRERKLPQGTLTTVAVLTLLAWTTLNTFYAFDPSFSWPYWDRVWKTIFMCIVAGTLCTNRVRFHSLIWIVAISVGYYGIKGGIFTFVTGGYYRVFGAEGILYDNNVLGIVMIMSLPLLNYLRQQSAAGTVRVGLVAAMILTVAAIFGTYSRETYITLCALLVAYWMQSKRKILFPALISAVVIPLLAFMPQSFFDRAASINRYSMDSSFQAHLDSWWVAYRYAMDHAPFGAGFYGLNLSRLWDQYIPGEMHAAHSIYFQALGEQGVVGLILYVLVLIIGFANFRWIVRKTRGSQKLQWAGDLAKAMQLSLMAFCVGGAAAPIAFFDLSFLLIMLGAALSALLDRQQVQLPAASSQLRYGLHALPRAISVGGAASLPT